MKPSPYATYERARRLANMACFSVALQRRRLMATEPEDGEFIFRKWVDFQFLIVALTKIRRAAMLACNVPELKPAISAAINTFDASLPNLKTMRDVAEHIDDYALDKGKNKHICRQQLEVLVINGREVQWIGHSLNADQAFQAAKSLFMAIQFNQPNKDA